VIARLAAAAWLVCCALTRGGLFDDGRPYGDVAYYGGYAAKMAGGQWPYRDFFDEYPPLAQPLFLVIRWLPGSYETAFRWTMALLGAAIVLLLVRRVPAALVLAFAPLLAGPILLNTYDLVPALLLLVALLVRSERTAMIVLALAVAAKVYPLVALPLLLVDARRLRSALAWFCGTLLLVHLPFLLLGPGGVRFSYWVQLKRGLEVESTGASLLLLLDKLGLYDAVLRDEPPGSKNIVGSTAQAVATITSLVAIAAVLLALRRRSVAAAVCGFVAFNKVFSPQYVAWLLAIVPTAGAVACAVLAAVLVLTHVVFDRFHAGDDLTWWVLPRDALVVALYVWLLRRARPGRGPAAAPPT
jgi:hypothetical protein